MILVMLHYSSLSTITIKFMTSTKNKKEVTSEHTYIVHFVFASFKQLTLCNVFLIVYFYKHFYTISIRRRGRNQKKIPRLTRKFDCCEDFLKYSMSLPLPTDLQS